MASVRASSRHDGKSVVGLYVGHGAKFLLISPDFLNPLSPSMLALITNSMLHR